MPNNYFEFKQFTIWQDRCAMKVGTDGVLLGAWAKTEGVKKILDIGTGTGLIALMLAQRSDAIIDALEIDSVAAEQAGENVKKSPWNDRVNIICDSFQNFSKLKHQYDLIVSNPPFFINSLRATDLVRTIARHNDKLMLNELMNGVVNFLSLNGRFCIIWPYLDYNLLKNISVDSGLFENRITYINPEPKKPIKRVIIEYSFTKKKNEENVLII